MKLMYLKTHYTAEEAYGLLMLVDDLRDSIWQNHRSEIIEYCNEEYKNKPEKIVKIEDDILPF